LLRDAEPSSIREVSVRELNRRTTQVLADVRGGRRVVVSRHGRPVALLLGIDEAVELLLANSEEFVRLRLAAREDLAEGRTTELGRLPGW
jgi:prevent-host-death family protein